MALGSHLITVRRLEKYINDVIGKKANLPDTSKTIIGNISQINSDLSKYSIASYNISQANTWLTPQLPAGISINTHIIIGTSLTHGANDFCDVFPNNAGNYENFIGLSDLGTMRIYTSNPDYVGGTLRVMFYKYSN